MKKIVGFLSIMVLSLIGLQSCDSDDNITGGIIDPEPELVGCEAADLYDWDTVEFETSLDGGADTWLAFSLDEITYFNTVFVSDLYYR